MGDGISSIGQHILIAAEARRRLGGPANLDHSAAESDHQRACTLIQRSGFCPPRNHRSLLVALANPALADNCVRPDGNGLKCRQCHQRQQKIKLKQSSALWVSVQPDC